MHRLAFALIYLTNAILDGLTEVERKDRKYF